MKKLKTKFNELLKDESAQGATEYILLLVVVVAIASLFRTEITTVVTDKINDLKAQISGFN